MNVKANSLKLLSLLLVAQVGLAVGGVDDPVAQHREDAC